jgi:hypothetical protein
MTANENTLSHLLDTGLPPLVDYRGPCDYEAIPQDQWTETHWEQWAHNTWHLASDMIANPTPEILAEVDNRLQFDERTKEHHES